VSNRTWLVQTLKTLEDISNSRKCVVSTTFERLGEGGTIPKGPTNIFSFETAVMNRIGPKKKSRESSTCPGRTKKWLFLRSVFCHAALTN
jgi:hypothetical protein